MRKSAIDLATIYPGSHSEQELHSTPSKRRYRQLEIYCARGYFPRMPSFKSSPAAWSVGVANNAHADAFGRCCGRLQLWQIISALQATQPE
jgi:hypothetical protein